VIEAGLDSAAAWAADEVVRRRMTFASAEGPISGRAALTAHLSQRIDRRWRPFYLDLLQSLGVIETTD